MMLKGTIYLTGARAVFIITGFLLHVSLGRWLGPEQFGVFGVINSIVTVIELIFLTSIAKGVSRFIAEKEHSIRSIINSALAIQSLSGLAIFGILFFGADLIASLLYDQEMSTYFRMLSVLIPLAGLAFVYESTLNGIREFGRQAVVMVIFHISRLIGALSFVYMGLAVKGAVLGLIVADVIRFIVGRQFCTRLRSKGNYDRKRLIKFSLNMAVFSFAGIVLMNIDLIAVKIILKEDSMTGFYNAALTLSKMLSFMVGGLSVTLFPSIVKSIADNNKELTERYVNQSLKYLLLIIIPLTFLISATSEGLISFVYGKVYSVGAQPLSILIFGWAFLTIAMMFNTIILASNKPYVAAIIALLLIPANIFLNLMFIQRMGINGAAIATTIVYSINCIISGTYVLLRFKTLTNPVSVARILLSSIIIYLIAVFYPAEGFMLFANYIALSIVFFVLLIILGEITLEDIMNLKGSILKKLQKEKIAV